MAKTLTQNNHLVLAYYPDLRAAQEATGPLVNFDALFDTFGIQSGDGMWREMAERAHIW